MEDCTRVLLYGTFDGFTYSTDDLPRITVVLDGGERVEVPEECVVIADQMVNKYKIRLKDVIERIEKFDLGTKAVWINEILNKLGSEYGFHKYCAGYKQGKFDGTMEREKVTVPQFVADWIVQAKEDGYNIAGAIHEAPRGAVDDWLELEKVDIFAEAWVNGYHIEKEKRYLVKIIGITNYNSYLNYHKGKNKWTIESCKETDAIRTEHTRKELEAAGFGEVFNSPLFEVEEVQDDSKI